MPIQNIPPVRVSQYLPCVSFWIRSWNKHKRLSGPQVPLHPFSLVVTQLLLCYFINVCVMFNHSNIVICNCSLTFKSSQIGFIITFYYVGKTVFRTANNDKCLCNFYPVSTVLRVFSKYLFLYCNKRSWFIFVCVFKYHLNKYIPAFWF